MAVNPPPHLRQDLATRLDACRADLALAWTRPEAWHLTLMFLGDWPGERVPALADGLRRAVAALGPVAILPGRLGAFPDLRRPRVLILHLDGGEPLRNLASGVRQAVDAAWPDGPQDRKDFRPHLTLARIKSPLDQVSRARLQSLDLGAWEPFAADQAMLMSSELRRDGARYEVQAELPLAGA